jgi:two-component system, NtrC family, sensor kinase
MTLRLSLRTKLVLTTMAGVALFGPATALLAHRWHPALPFTLAAAVLAAGAVAAWSVRSVMAPVGRLTEAARRWAREEMGHRAALSGGDEFETLGRALDQMASAIQHRDETARLRADERLAQAERLATVGRLAAGVAHEINNPLGGILLYSDLLLETTPADDPRRHNMTQISVQAQRALEIVKGLLDFARQSPPNVERRDLNRIVAEVLSLTERQADSLNVQLRTELSAVPLWVRVDTGQIQQVLVNIIINALDAMRGGGALTVRSGFSERAGLCRVAFSDTGPGIREEDMARLFDPFFTTKEVGKGVGLGLAISYGIVQQHGGEIDVQSAAGSGTTFRVLLPVERDEA